MKHQTALEKLYSSIYKDIDLIVESQEESGGQLDIKASQKLVEYAKLLRSDKNDMTSTSNLTDEELDQLLKEELKKLENK